MGDNWYVILELEFDPPIVDEQKILERIEEKAKFWSTNFQDFKNGAQYRAHHQNIPKIKKDMLGETNIRAELAKEACDIVYPPIDEVVKMLGRNKKITVDEVDRLSKAKKISVEVIRKRAKKLGIEFEEVSSAKKNQDLYDKYYKNKPKDANRFDGMKQQLSTFGVDNLYDFLYANTTTKNADKLPCNTLIAQAVAKKKNDYFKHDSVSGTGSKLCQQCEIAFKDESSKASYDEYLEYNNRREILTRAKELSQISEDGITVEHSGAIVRELTYILRDVKQAEDLLFAFCKIEKIPYSASTKAVDTTHIKVCRCGYINDVADGRKVCADCGQPLKIKCPSCNTENDANIKVCKCSFRFENMDTVRALCNQADNAVEALDFETARVHLAEAQRRWKNSDMEKEVQAKLAEFEQRVGKEVAVMRGAIKEKRYCEARAKYSNVKKLFPSYSDSAMEEEISQAIEKAQGLFNQAKKATAEKDVLELCVGAFDICTDLPGIKELMPTPPQISSISVKTDPVAKTNVVSWSDIGDRSVRYVVVRNTSGWVKNISDGEVVFRGSANAYADDNILPATQYYYNVFTERAGISSLGAKKESDAVVNLFEVSGVNAVGANSSLNIIWDDLPDNATAEIYQVQPTGKESLVATTVASSYLISNLENDNTYSYRVALSYTVSGEKMLTGGVNISGTPTCPPLPIDTLRVKATQDNTYEATWYQNDNTETRLFCSTSKPPYSVGEVVAISALEQEMQPLQLLPLPNKSSERLKAGESGFSFQYSGTELLYVVAIAVKSGSGVFGSLGRASKGSTVNIKEIRPVNGQINIFLDAPTSATGFVVLYSFERFATDIEDREAIRKHIPIKQFQYSGAIVIDTLEPRKYFFSVFAEFRADGEIDYSSAMDYIFDNTPSENITYSISVSKKLFSTPQIVLEFEGENKEFELPAVDIMSAIGNTPMFKASAQLLHTVEAQHVKGTVQVKIPAKGIPKNTFIKAFFADENAHDANQLRIKLKSNNKIT